VNSHRWVRTGHLRLAGALLLAGSTAWHAFDISTSGPTDRAGRLKGADFLQFYTYGVLATRDPDRLYDPAAHAHAARTHVEPPLELSTFRPNYSPVIAWMARPLTTLPYSTALAWFSAGSWMLFVVAVGVLVSTTTALRPYWKTTLLLAIAWPTIFVVLRYGQISAATLLVLSCATAAFAAKRDATAGGLLGLLAFRPQLLVVPVLAFAANRRYRLLAGLLAGVSMETLVNVALVGIESMREYAGTLAGLAQQPDLVQFFPAESHSLRGFVRLLTGAAALAQPASWVAVVLAAVAVVRVWQVQPDWRPRWSGLVLAMLVGSPHVLSYDLLLLAVPILLLVDWVMSADRTDWRLWRAPLAVAYFGAWPGTFIARVYQVQPSTIAMLWLLYLLARRRSAGQS
jgi:alpha-1,2-mannosyltransferase